MAGDFEWNFDSSGSRDSDDRKPEFNTIGVANARHRAERRSPPETKTSYPERRSASVGGPGGFRKQSSQRRGASALSYQQLLSSATITYQEIYGGSRMYRNYRPIYYIPNKFDAAIRY